MRSLVALIALASAGAGDAWETPDLDALEEAQQARDQQRLADARATLDAALRGLEAARAAAREDAAVEATLVQRIDALVLANGRRRDQLAARQGEVGDLYNVARQAAGDLVATLHESATAPPSPTLETELRALAANPRPLALDDLAALWEGLHTVLTHSATADRAQVQVQVALAQLRDAQVTRIGTQLAYAGVAPIRYDHVSGVYRATHGHDKVSSARTPAGLVALPVLGTDPSMPASARLARSGPVGALIVALGILGAGLLVLRAIRVLRLARAQRLGRPDSPSARLASARALHGNERGESLAGWLNAAVRREVRRLAWGQAALRVSIAAAPLLGLLGTVTGMIIMFEQLRLYGGGDPVLMARGIAQALETTWLGLVVALPLLLGHRAVLSVADSIVRALDREALAWVASARPLQ